MLHPEAQERDPAFAHSSLDDGGLLGDGALAHQPPALKEAVLRVGRHHVIALGKRRHDAPLALEARGLATHVEGGAPCEKSAPVRRHAPGERLRRVEINVEYGSGNEEVRVVLPLRHVAHVNPEDGERELRRTVHGDERTPRAGELVQMREAGSRHASRVGLRHRPLGETRDHTVKVVVGEQDHVEPRRKASGAQVLVVDRLEGELELLEHPAGPTLVDVPSPRVVNAEPRRRERHEVSRCLRESLHDEPELARERGHAASRGFDDEGTRGPAVEARGRSGDGDAFLQQAIHGDERIVHPRIEGIAVASLALDAPFGRSGAIDRRRLDADPRLDLVHADPHLERQRPAGDVVRALRRSARIETPVRIDLRIQQIRQVGAERLRSSNEKAPRGVGRPTGGEGGLGALHPNPAHPQHVHELGRRGPVPLFRRDHVGLVRPRRDGFFAHAINVVEPLLAALGSDVEHRHRARLHVAAAIPETPRSAPEGIRVVRRGLARQLAVLETLRKAFRIVGHRHRRGVPRLGEDPDHVVIVGRCPHPPVPPRVEREPRDDARLVLLVEPPRHRLSDEVHPPHHERRDVRVHRVFERRHEDPGGKRCLLVLVVDDLREPHLVELTRDVLRLGLVEHVPVSVVVVSDVLLVELGRARFLEGRSLHAPVPVDDDRRSVRVDVGNQHEENVVANGAHFLGLVRDRTIGHERRRLRVGPFRRVQTEVDPDDGFALLRERPSLVVVVNVREGELSRDLLVAVEVSEILLGADDGEQHRSSLRRLADLVEAHSLRSRVEPPEVIRDLIVVRELTLGAGRKAEDGLGRRNLGIARRQGRSQERGEDDASGQ